MKIRLTDKGRDLAQRLRQTESDLQAVRAESNRPMTPVEQTQWRCRLVMAEAALAAVRAELEANLPS
jgi:hypothetical protein